MKAERWWAAKRLPMFVVKKPLRLSGLISLTLLSLFVAGCGGDSAPGPSSTGQWIYYASNDGTNTYINQTRSDGTSPSILATLNPNYQGYAANASGTQIAFGYSLTSSVVGATYSLCVGPKLDVSTATSQTAYLYDSIGSIQFRSDNSQVFYTAAPVGDLPGLYRLDLVSGKVEYLDAGVDMQISPDGATVLYTKPVGSGLELFTMSVDGKAGSGVQLTADGRIKQLPTWSPDGTEIAYVGYGAAPPYAGYVLSRAGKDLGTQPKVSDPNADLLGIAFSPEGSKLATIRVNNLDPTKSGLYVGAGLVAANDQVTGPIFWLSGGFGPAFRSIRSLAGFARISFQRASSTHRARPR